MIVSSSASTQPGFRFCNKISSYAIRTIYPCRSIIMQRVLVVPWSSARMYDFIDGLLFLQAGLAEH